MLNILNQFSEAVWDVLGLSSFKRNEKFLKNAGLEAEYTRDQHAAYKQAMIEKGYAPKSVSYMLDEHTGRAQYWMYMKDIEKRDKHLNTMAAAFNTLADVTGQKFVASYWENKQQQDTQTFMVGDPDAPIILKHITSQDLAF